MEDINGLLVPQTHVGARQTHSWCRPPDSITPGGHSKKSVRSQHAEGRGQAGIIRKAPSRPRIKIAFQNHHHHTNMLPEHPKGCWTLLLDHPLGSAVSKQQHLSSGAVPLLQGSTNSQPRTRRKEALLISQAGVFSFFHTKAVNTPL